MKIENPFIKSLSLFDPKKDLEVNEKFRQMIESSSGDTISELMSDSSLDGGSSNSGKEAMKPLKTTASIISGIEIVESAAGKFVFVANKTGRMYLVTTKGGKFHPLWSVTFPGTFMKKPVVQDNMAYLVSKEGGVIALDLGIEGRGNKPTKPRVIWNKKLSKGILSEPVITKKMLLVASLSGLFAFDIYDQEKSKGRLLWQKSIGAIASSPVYGSGLIIFGNESKKIYALRDKGDDAGILWKVDTNDSVRMKPLLTKRDNFVVAACIGGTVYFIDRDNGKVVWIFITHSPVFSSIISTIHNNMEVFLFGDDNGVFYCLSSAGKELWRYKTHGKIRTEALVHKSTVYFGSYDNYFYALDIASGKLRFKFATEGHIEGLAKIMDENILFGSGDSFLYNLHS